MNLRLNEKVGIELIPNGGYEQGSVQFSAEPDGVVGIELDPDNPLKATLHAVAAGTATIQGSLDGDQDPGAGEVNTLIATGAVVVLVQDSTAIELDFGPVQPA